jgi:hypothetical protein
VQARENNSSVCEGQVEVRELVTETRSGETRDDGDEAHLWAELTAEDKSNSKNTNKFETQSRSDGRRSRYGD